MSRFKAQSPGKVILTGEHAVLHQQPAIALAVDCYSYADFSPSNGDASLSVSLPDFNREYHFDDLAELRYRLNAQHAAFQAGQVSLPLCNPGELLAYACNQPGSLTVSSTIPIGSGMGSSASVIAATLCASQSSREQQERLDSAKQAEALQHGRSSGLDTDTCTLGGLVSAHIYLPSTQPTMPPLQLLFTGNPSVSTGEVVRHVTRTVSKSIWPEFGQVSRSMIDAMYHHDHIVFLESVKQNHRLLEAIDVVPQKVSQLVAQIEQLGGAAKIAGAGAHQGDNAGIVLCWGLDIKAAGITDTSTLQILTVNPDWVGAQLL